MSDTGHNGTDSDEIELDSDVADEPFYGDEQPSRGRPEKDQSTIGRLAAKAITTIPKPLLGVRGTLFKRMAVKGLENYYKVSGGDAIAINAKAGQTLDLEPVAYRSPEEVDEGEKHGWRVKGRDKVWNPASEGNSVNYLGRTPTIVVEDDDHVEAGFLAPRIGQAIETDQYAPVFTNPTFKSVFEVDGQQQRAESNALADGGEVPQIHQSLDRWAQNHVGGLDLELPGQFTGETLIDIDSGEGYDGMRVSGSKAREWQAETAESEQMQMQEDRGYIRGLAQAEDGPSMTKLLLICAGIILGVLAIVFIGPQLAGGGGGGGGLNPLMINAVGALAPL